MSSKSVFSEPYWDAAKAVVLLSRRDGGWIRSSVTEKDVVHAASALAEPGSRDQLNAGIPLELFVEAVRDQWPDTLPKLHPLVWVKWALDREGPDACREVLVALAKWNFRGACKGRVRVMTADRDGPSLEKEYGIEGRGWPLEVFLASNELNLSLRWELQTHFPSEFQSRQSSADPTSPTATRSSSQPPALAPSPSPPLSKPKSRSAGAAKAVEAALQELVAIARLQR